MAQSRTEAWEYIRAGGDVYKTADGWILTSAEACRYAARHPEFFSNSISGEMASCPGTYVPNGVDPPDHSRYRRIVDPLFSPRVINGIEDELRARLNEMIDKFADTGECEIMRDIAEIFPTQVFALMFGIPLDELDAVVKMAHDTMSAGMDGSKAELARQAGVELYEYVTVLLDRKRSEPGDDVLSKIATDSRYELSNDEAVGLAFNVAQGGLDTVTSAIGFMMYYLAERPDLRRKILAQPEDVDPFIEEIIRLESVAPFLPRLTTQDVEICGTTIPAGSFVLIGYGPANRDPSEFSVPNDVDLTQGRGSHMGFGSSHHRCLGSHLARRELRVMFEEFHRRIPDYELAADVSPTVRWPSLVPCLDSVPLKFTVSS